MFKDIKKTILEKQNGKKIKFNINKFNDIFGECPFLVKTINNFLTKIEQKNYTHEIDEGILKYLIFEIFSIKNKNKELIIKKEFESNGFSLNEEDLKEAYIRAEILLETIVSTDENGEVEETNIKTVKEETTLDDVNDLVNGVGDNDPFCGPKSEPSKDGVFQSCDLEYGLEVLVYNSSKIPWADYRLQLPVFRGPYVISENSESTINPLPPLSCGYKIENSYPFGDCRKILEFPDGQDGEERDPLRDALLHYDFFIEDQEGYDNNQNIPPYIFQIGHSGTAEIYPLVDDIFVLNRSISEDPNDPILLETALRAKNLDFNGMFDEEDPAFRVYNRQESVSSIADTIAQTSSITGTVLPSVVTHSTYSFIATEENIVINEKYTLKNISVPKDEDGERESEIVFDLGNMLPLHVIAVTEFPIEITIEDIKNGQIPEIEDNLFKGIVYEEIKINGGEDGQEDDLYVSGDIQNYPGSRGYSKFLGGYDFYFDNNAVNKNANKRIIENPELKDADGDIVALQSENIRGNSTNSIFRGNSLTSNKIRISSSIIPKPDDEDDRVPSFYITAIVANKNYYRQIVQVHNKISNRRPIHNTNEQTVNNINPTSGAFQPPFPTGDYLDYRDEYNKPDGTWGSPPNSIVESFIFNQFCHKKLDGTNGYEWRMTELATNAELIWRRWMISNNNDAPFITQDGASPLSIFGDANTLTTQGEKSTEYTTYGDAEPMFYSADTEGIKLFSVNFDGTFRADILLPREEILDQKWFKHYLATTGREGKKLEDELDLSDDNKKEKTNRITSGLLFDVSYYINNSLPDHYKLPYERCFAAAIMQCSKAIIQEEDEGDNSPPLTPGPEGDPEESDTAVGIGIPHLDLVGNPYITGEIPDTISETEEKFLWCEPGQDEDGGLIGGAGTSPLIDNPDPFDKKLLVSSLELLISYYNFKGRTEEASSVSGLLKKIISKQSTQRPNDLSYAIFVSKIAGIEEYAGQEVSLGTSQVSGYGKNLIVRRFSDEMKEKYIQNFQRTAEYISIFGPDSTRQSIVTVPANGSIVYAYPRSAAEAETGDEEEALRDLPPGRYRITYIGGGFLYGCGDGRKASIHDPDTLCDGVYVRFNSPAPCAENQFIAPGTRDPYDNIADLENDFLDSPEGTRVISHLGGPISFQLILKERSIESCEDGQSTVFCAEDQCLQYCVSPVIAEGANSFSEVQLTPLISDQYIDLNMTTLKNYIELPLIYESSTLSQSTRYYVESFGIARDPQGNSETVNGFEYLHPFFNCLGMYPDHAVEHLNLLETGDADLRGDLSVSNYCKKDYGILTTPEFATGAISYHNVNFEKHSAWKKFGLPEEKIENLTKVTEEFLVLETEEGSSEFSLLEDSNKKEVEFAIKSRSDQIQKGNFAFYNRGKIINTIEGALCVNQICARSVVPPEYNLATPEEAYFYTDGKELRESIEGIKNKDIKGWVKDVVLNIPVGGNSYIDYIGFSPFGKREDEIVSSSKLAFFPSGAGTPSTQKTVYQDGVHLLSKIRTSNPSGLTGNQRVDVSYGRVYEGGEFFHSENFDPSSIVEVKYLRDEFFEKYKITNSRHSTVTDEKNRTFVFYEQKGNISVAMGYNLDTAEERWFNFEGIVRLLSGEIATQPYVVSNNNKRTFHLFFKLNGIFICHKDISPSNFIIKDAFKEYYPISNFNEETSDDYGLTQFEFEGRDIRRGTINIIAGGGSSEDCISVSDIVNEVKSREKENLIPRIRFGFKCVRNEKILEEEFAAYVDRKGHLVIFFTSEKRQFMNIMRSNNAGIDWLDVQRYLHMTHLPFLGKDKYNFECSTGLADNGCEPSSYLIFDDAEDEGCFTREISSFQITFDGIKNIIYLIFIYNEALYVRQFDASYIDKIAEVLAYDSAANTSPLVSNAENSTVIQNIIKNHFNLRDTSDNKPVFLVGKKIENDLEKTLYVNFSGGSKSKGRGVFSPIRPASHVTKDGILKIYYFDKDLTLWSVPLLPGSLNPIP